MPLTQQFFQHGFDCTGTNPLTGADLNLLMDQGTPYMDNGVGSGKGMVLFTTDVGVNAPDVPNAATYNPWKNCLWCRTTLGISTQILYSWNDANINDPTYLKWTKIVPDLTSLNASIAAAQATANQANNTANLANALATAANTTANQANTNVNNTLNTANNALAAATAAQTTATTASNQVTAAQTAITHAQTDATTALTTLSTFNNTNLTTANSPAGGSKLRTNAANAAFEYFKELDNYFNICESHNSGINGAATATGVNVRVLNLVNSNTGALIDGAIPGGKIKFLVAGTYRINAWAVGTAGVVAGHQALFVRDSDNVVFIIGSAEHCSVNNNTKSFINGIVTVAANDVFRVDHWFNGNGAFGTACGAHTNEIYLLVEGFKMN